MPRYVCFNLIIVLALFGCGGGGGAAEVGVSEAGAQGVGKAAEVSISKFDDQGGGDLTYRFAGKKPLVVAHRGASGYLPEHTLGGYELAVRMGADYIETDLHQSKDGELVAMHDPTLNRTTNVASLFAPRNGGYRVKDFTLLELKSLTVLPINGAKASREGFTPTSPDPWRVPTVREIMELARRLQRPGSSEIGLYIELKPSGQLIENALIQALTAAGYTARSAVVIQSFSDGTLRRIRSGAATLRTPFVQALLGSAVISSDGLPFVAVATGAAPKLLSFKEVATFAEIIAVVIDPSTHPISKEFIDQAHAAGLQVHGWTFATSNPSQAASQYKHYLDLGMDGLITNFTDLALTAKILHLSQR